MKRVKAKLIMKKKISPTTMQMNGKQLLLRLANQKPSKLMIRLTIANPIMGIDHRNLHLVVTTTIVRQIMARGGTKDTEIRKRTGRIREKRTITEDAINPIIRQVSSRMC
jgi:hypothetical protein